MRLVFVLYNCSHYFSFLSINFYVLIVLEVFIRIGSQFSRHPSFFSFLENIPPWSYSLSSELGLIVLESTVAFDLEIFYWCHFQDSLYISPTASVTYLLLGSLFVLAHILQ